MGSAAQPFIDLPLFPIGAEEGDDLERADCVQGDADAPSGDDPACPEIA